MKIKIKILFLFILNLLIACKNTSNNNLKMSDSRKSGMNDLIKNIKHEYSHDSIIDLVYKSKNKKCHIDSIGGFYIPKNLKDSHLVLDTMLNDSTKIFIANGEESHFGLGMYLRNNWGLWGGSRLKCYFELKGIEHPDHMSGMIISTYSMKLNKKKIQEDSIIHEALRALEEWNKQIEN